MVLLVPLFSLTISSCGGDDDEEHGVPGTSSVSSTFLIGGWSKTNAGNSPASTIKFYNDGTFESVYWSPNYYPKYIQELVRGTWKLKDRILIVTGIRYSDGEYSQEYSATINCFYDEYTQKLVLKNIEANVPSIIDEGSYSKMG